MPLNSAILRKIILPILILITISIAGLIYYTIYWGEGINGLNSLPIRDFWLIALIYLIPLIPLFYLIKYNIINIIKYFSLDSSDSPSRKPPPKSFTISIQDIEDVSQVFAHRMGNLQESCVKLKSSNDFAGLISSKLFSHSETTATVIDNIVGIAGQIKNMTQELGEIIENNAAATSEMSGSLENLSTTIELQIQSVSETTSFVKAITDRLNEIAQIARDSRLSIASMLEKINLVKEQIISNTQHTTDIKNKSSRMLEIVEVISHISDKTNLLAMNASIEAAHAGHHGSGFKVVASEIKKLAEQSNTNSKQITEHIKENLFQIDESANQSQETLDEFIEVIKEIENTAHNMVTIINMLEELSVSNSKTLEGLKQLVHVSDEVKSSSLEMNQSRLVVIEQLSELVGLETSAEEAAEQIVHEINQIPEEMENILFLVVKNKESLEENNFHLKKFNIENGQVIFKKPKLY